MNTPQDLPSVPGAAALKPAPSPAQKVIEVRPVARSARLRLRHVLLTLSFMLWVVAPLCLAGGYLYVVANDQYASHVGFTVRTEEVSSASELLSNITGVSGASSSDTDILYEFITSQQLVRKVHDRFDLASVYQRPGDPVFTLGDDIRIEALSAYWERMVKVYYDRTSGLIEVRVLAFDPDHAQSIAAAVYDESSTMINELSAIAREDATRYAEEELTLAEARLTVASQKLTAFRNRTQIVDPAADIQGQMGLLNSLNAQMAEAQIGLELLLNSSTEADPRVRQAKREMVAIQKLIDDERARFGVYGSGGEEDQFSQLLEEYQALALEQEFAEQSYLSAKAARDVAVAEAQRQSRYLGGYIPPTLAETPEYPQRIILMAVLAAFLFISWAIMVLVYYSLRDRR